MLTSPQIQRYVRQLLLPEIGLTGQERLVAASFDLPGHGLAVVTARDYLARAGVDLGSTAQVRAAAGLHCALSDTGFAWSTDGSPCEACLQAWVASLSGPPPSSERAAIAMTTGALAASQLLLAPLGLLTGAAFGRGVGYAVWPALVRREIEPRAGCGCQTVAGG